MKSKLLFSAAIAGLFSFGAANAQCTQPIVEIPYFMGFEDTDDIACLTYEDVNGGIESGWMIENEFFPTQTGDASMIYVYDLDLPGDDWFFTPGLNLVGGVSYNLDFLYRSGLGSAFLLENMEVKLGNEASSTAMTTTLFTAENIDTDFGSDFTPASITFTPPLSGTYYIGFHSYSEADQGYIQIDDLMVTSALAVDSFNKELLSYNNPVKDLLEISYPGAISEVSLYNLLGQQVLQASNASQVDTSHLTSGTYVAKITADGATATVKVVKH